MGAFATGRAVRRAATTLSIACALAGTSGGAALAGSASFSIPTTGMVVSSGATAGEIIKFPGGSTNFAILNFRLPVDFKKNGKARVIVALDAVGAPCNVRLVGLNRLRARKGAVYTNGSAKGVKPEDGTNNVAITGNAIVAEKSYLITRVAEFSGVKPRDVVSMFIQRDGANMQDFVRARRYRRGRCDLRDEMTLRTVV